MAHCFRLGAPNDADTASDLTPIDNVSSSSPLLAAAFVILSIVGSAAALAIGVAVASRPDSIFTPGTPARRGRSVPVEPIVHLVLVVATRVQKDVLTIVV